MLDFQQKHIFLYLARCTIMLCVWLADPMWVAIGEELYVDISLLSRQVAPDN